MAHGLEIRWVADAPESWNLERPPELSDFNGDRDRWNVARNTWYQQATKAELPATNHGVARERDWNRALHARRMRLKRKQKSRSNPQQDVADTIELPALTPVPVGAAPSLESSVISTPTVHETRDALAGAGVSDAAAPALPEEAEESTASQRADDLAQELQQQPGNLVSAERKLAAAPSSEHAARERELNAIRPRRWPHLDVCQQSLSIHKRSMDTAESTRHWIRMHGIDLSDSNESIMRQLSAARFAIVWSHFELEDMISEYGGGAMNALHPVDVALRTGQLDDVEWMHTAGYLEQHLRDTAMWGHVAHSGSLQVTQWIAARPSFWSIDQAAACCIAAASAGSLNVFSWAYDEYLRLYARMMENNCSRTLAFVESRVAAYHWYGADEGSLADNVYAAAARAGSDNALRWAWDRGLPLPEDTATLTTDAAGGGHLSTLRWLLSRGCKWEAGANGACRQAWSRGFNEVAKWTAANGAPCTAELRAQIDVGTRIQPLQLLDWNTHGVTIVVGWERDGLSHGSVCSICVHNSQLPAYFRDTSQCKCCNYCTRNKVAAPTSATNATVSDEALASAVARLNEPDTRVREDILKALRQVKPASALSPHACAIAAMTTDADDDVQIAALNVLGRLEPNVLCEHAAAIKANLDDPDVWVRHAALVAFTKMPPATLSQHASAIVMTLTDCINQEAITIAVGRALQQMDATQLSRASQKLLAHAFSACAPGLSSTREVPQWVHTQLQSLAETFMGSHPYPLSTYLVLLRGGCVCHRFGRRDCPAYRCKRMPAAMKSEVSSEESEVSSEGEAPPEPLERAGTSDSACNSHYFCEFDPF